MLLFSAGCGSGGFRFSPSEQQKQAADLAVTDLVALKPHVSPAAEELRLEAETAAKVTQIYIGLPKNRPHATRPENKTIIQQAGDVASKRPTDTEVALDAIDTGLGTADAVIGLLGVIAGTWGLGKFAGKINGWRQRAHLTGDALRETVKAIESAKADIPSEAVGILRDKLTKSQSRQTKLAIDAMRR